MKVLICGDRNWADPVTINNFISILPKNTIIIQGEARGADTIAKKLGEAGGYTVKGFKANWKQYGRAAGPIRNHQMIDEGKPDLVVAFHNNIHQSRGTKNMLLQAAEQGIPSFIISSLPIE